MTEVNGPRYHKVSEPKAEPSSSVAPWVQAGFSPPPLRWQMSSMQVFKDYAKELAADELGQERA